MDRGQNWRRGAGPANVGNSRGRGAGTVNGGMFRGRGGRGAARQLCRFIQNPEGCRFGTSCRFSHDVSTSPTNAARGGGGTGRRASPDENSEAREQYYSWKHLLKYHAATYRKVWREALEILDNGDREWQQQLVKDLVSDTGNGLQIVKDTLAVATHDKASQLPVALKFLQVITHPALLDCLSVEPYLGTLYTFIGGVNGERGIQYFTDLCQVLEQQGFGHVSLLGVTQDEMGLMILKALHEFLARERRALFSDNLKPLIGTLDRLCQALKDPHKLRCRIETIKRVSKNASGLVATTASSGSPAITGLAAGRITSTFPMPLIVPGGQHDNDFADMSKINILPTLEEIMCGESEFLPSTNFTQPHFLEDRIQRYIDTAFRLLRHDVFGPMKEDLKAMFEAMNAKTRRHGHSPPLKLSQVRAHVYEKAGISRILVDGKRGLEAHVSFEPPPQVRGRKKSFQEQWWQESNRLAEGGLACLVLPVAGQIRILFLVITAKNAVGRGQPDGSHLVAGYSSTIAVKLASRTSDNIGLLCDLHGDRAGDGVLVDLPSLIPATFVPVLETLQRIWGEGDLALHSWIVPGSRDPAAGAAINPPAYARGRGFRFQLDAITSAENPAGPVFVRPSAPEETDLEAIRTATGLDQGQAQSLVSALSREYALVQGPPGTGKSYVGVQILRVLLAHKSSAHLGPIVIICYTNHALDQFLKHLLDVGIEKIIRIGGQSRAPELAGKNLRVVNQGAQKTRVEQYCLGKAYSSRERDLTTAENFLRPLLLKTQDRPNWKLLSAYLYKHHPRIHAQFRQVDKDGFKVVGRPLFDLWLAGHAKGDTGQENDVPSGNDRPEQVNLALDVHRTEQRAERDAYSLSQAERWALATSWLANWQDTQKDLLFEAVEGADMAQQEIDDIHQEVSRRALLNADVIGITTTGFARNASMLRRLRAKVIVCEEAAEVMEPHIINTLMPGVEHLIQIGDHRQLRPQIQNFSLSLESHTGDTYQLDRSQFERRALGEPGMPATPVAQLNVQRRMRPEISCLIRRIYPSLEDHESVHSLPHVVGMKDDVFWLDHDHMESMADTHLKSSHSNDWEVQLVKALVRHFVRQGTYKADDIAVLTPYTGQLRKLRTGLSEDFEIFLSDRDEDALAADGFENDPDAVAANPDKSGPAAEGNPSHKPLEKKKLIESLRLATVDNFQGEEAKIIIVSLVRSNKNKKVGFLRTENRINVLVSRAQHGMYLVGNTDTYLNVEFWAAIHDQLAQVDAVGKAFRLCCPRHPENALLCSTSDDFARLSPEGGCSLPCTDRLGCGHRCQAKCHSRAMHEVVFCMQACPRIRKTCSHACPRMCGEECGLCMVEIEGVTLPCGHVQTLRCHQTLALSSVRCPVVVSKVVAGCGHTVQTACHTDVSLSTFRCLEPCLTGLDCGHECPGSCDRCRSVARDGTTSWTHQVCQKTCKRPSSTCDHLCPRPCHSGEACGSCAQPCQVKCPHSKCAKACCDPCAPCLERCTWHCSHRGACFMPCAAPCDRLPCDKRCEKTLQCGHQCPGICGEVCAESYCHVCCTPAKKNARVDFYELKEYSDIDPDETPIVVLGCGHFFTVESLDGHVGMSEVYDVDPRTGQYLGLQDITTGAMAKLIPTCPDCKRPIRQFATKRYNRVINRAVMDETSKRFVTLGHTKLEVLEKRVQAYEAGLEATREKIASKADLDYEQLEKKYEQQRYAPGRLLERGTRALERQMDTENQPAKKLVDAINLRRAKLSRGQPDASITGGSAASPTQVGALNEQVPLRARLLTLRVRCAMLRDMIGLLRKEQNGKLSAALGGHPTKLTPPLLKDCLGLIAKAKDHNLPKMVVQASLYFAQIAIIMPDCSSSSEGSGGNTAGAENGQAKPSKPSKSKSDIVDPARCRGRASELLEEALRTCGDFGESMVELGRSVESLLRMVQGPRYEKVTDEELAAIKQAMVSGPQGIITHSRHWYNCVNGHPFAIGDCGMPMERARCPECNAPIGGQAHTAVEGVTRAMQMEQ